MGSHPAWVCGLKHDNHYDDKIDDMSHPAWVCGLKLLMKEQMTEGNGSHPAWVCGLKLNRLDATSDWFVTPCVGVWIETQSLAQKWLRETSHPAWVCGLKHFDPVTLGMFAQSHPAWVCGLKLLL